MPIETKNVDRASAIIGVHDNPLVVTSQRLLTAIDPAAAGDVPQATAPAVAGMRVYAVAWKCIPIDQDVAAEIFVTLKSNLIPGPGTVTHDADYMGLGQKRGVPTGVVLPAPVFGAIGSPMELTANVTDPGDRVTAVLYYYYGL